MMLVHEIVFQHLENKASDDAIMSAISARPELGFLSTDEGKLRRFGRKFSTDTKSEITLRDYLQKGATLTCPECGARLQRNAMVMGHHLGIKDGGMGARENGAWTHPYCNSIKN